MACRNFYRNCQTVSDTIMHKTVDNDVAVPEVVGRLLFGVDSTAHMNNLLQNNITQLEWVERNKIYPNFCGRYLNGMNSLNADEIKFLHSKGCKIAAIYSESCAKQSEKQGEILAKNVTDLARDLGVPHGTAIYLEINETESITHKFLYGFAKTLSSNNFTAGFKANTDARYSFDREYSRGIQSNKDVFLKTLIWAVSPSLEEFNGITTTHLIHPDNWKPYAPSGITRRQIAIWQYGKDCHPIEDDNENRTTFNLNLVRNEQVIIDKMFLS